MLTGGCAGCAHSPESVQLVSRKVLSTLSACSARRMQLFGDECVMGWKYKPHGTFFAEVQDRALHFYAALLAGIYVCW